MTTDRDPIDPHLTGVDPEYPNTYWRVRDGKREFLNPGGVDWHSEDRHRVWFLHPQNATFERIVLWTALGWNPSDAP